MTAWIKTGNSTWTQINSIFNKTGASSWTELLGVWVKTGVSAWTKVFTRVSVPANTVLPAVTGNQYLYATLTGTLGTWTSPNGTNSYSRQWQRANNSGGSAGAYSSISGATSSTYTTVLADNNKFVRVNVTATNLSGSSSAASSDILITKYSAVSLLPHTISGSPIVGVTLTAVEQAGSWKQTTTNSGDTSPDTFEYEWSYSNGTIRQSTAYNSINSSSYLIVNADLNNTIRVRVTGTNSGGSDTSGYTTSGTITSVYSFNFGNTLYVGSNGYITLDQAPSSAIAALPAGNGRTINIWNEDLVNYRIQEYSDGSNYHLYFRSYRYQSPLVQSAINALDYQIKFYTGQSYCDVYLFRKGSSVPAYIDNPGYYANGLFQTSGFSGTFVAGSVLRVYFNGTAASTSVASWTSISDSLWKNVSTATIDDGYVAVVTSANQQATLLTAPNITSVSSTVENAPVTAYYTGGSGPYYQIYWSTGSAPQGAVTPDAEGSSSSQLTDNTGPPTTGYTYYMYVRSVLSLGETSVGQTSLASNWSVGVSFTVSITPVYPTISGLSATSIASTSAIISWSSTNQDTYSISGGPYYLTGSTATSRSISSLSSSTFYNITVVITSSSGHTTQVSFAFYTTSAAIIPTVSMNANTNISTSGATINWSSTNQSYAYVDSTNVGNVNSYTFSGLSSSTSYSGSVTVVSSTGNTAATSYAFTTSTPAPVTPTITSGPYISWGSGNNFTLSASASNATNLEFQVQYSSSQSGSPSTGSGTYFFGASTGGGTTGGQAANRSWARTRVRANNTSTGLSSAFSAYTAYA